MKRRNILKAISFGSMGLAVLPVQAKVGELDFTPKEKKKISPGRTKAEAEREASLQKEQFFTKAELITVTLLCDIIIPADEKSGSASQAGVPDFIEFMMKDQPKWQTPMRGGLKWLDNQCRKRFGNPFSNCSHTQQIEMVEMIAFPELAKPEVSQGIAFFNMMRNFTASGFFTSEMGIKDLGYVGNVPNNWEGVPKDVLAQYGLTDE